MNRSRFPWLVFPILAAAANVAPAQNNCVAKGQKPAFSWDLQFDLVLPQKAAGAGPGC